MILQTCKSYWNIPRPTLKKNKPMNPLIPSKSKEVPFKEKKKWKFKPNIKKRTHLHIQQK